MDDEIYRQKYLKYKAKYLNLKQTGGITAKTGTWIYVFPVELMAKMKINNYKPGILSIKYLSVREINAVLNNIGYECKIGGNIMSIVRSTDSKIVEGVKNAASVAGTGIKNAASVAGTGIVNAASVAGTGIVNAASTAGTGIKNAASSAGTGIVNAASSAGTGIKYAAQSVGNKLGETLIRTGERMRTLPSGELIPVASGGADQIIQLSKITDLNDLKSIINDVAIKLGVQPNKLCSIAVRMKAQTANTIVSMAIGE